ncbi:MAG: hypothetical protein JXA03_14680 [Bacteroidales bacterium]|nr:hypothetical protein [Bacteroidales bacterium]
MEIGIETARNRADTWVCPYAILWVIVTAERADTRVCPYETQPELTLLTSLSSLKRGRRISPNVVNGTFPLECERGGLRG